MYRNSNLLSTQQIFFRFVQFPATWSHRHRSCSTGTDLPASRFIGSHHAACCSSPEISHLQRGSSRAFHLCPISTGFIPVKWRCDNEHVFHNVEKPYCLRDPDAPTADRFPNRCKIRIMNRSNAPDPDAPVSFTHTALPPACRKADLC